MKMLKFLFKYYLFRSTRKVENIERVIRSHGVRIHPFCLDDTEDPVTKLLDDLGAIEYAQHHIAFLAANRIINAVFLKDGLSDDDQNKLLFHEEAHIWYNDTNTTSFTDETDVQQENRANLFLFKLRMLKAAVYGLFATLFLLLSALIAGAMI